MIPAMYPLLKEAYKLDFTQIGLITLAFHVTSSLLQPVLGYVTDHKPWAYAMVAGMTSTLIGVVGLASANNYAMVLVSVALVGLGSAVFHPEATRMARHAAAGHQGFAQGSHDAGLTKHHDIARVGGGRCHQRDAHDPFVFDKSPHPFRAGACLAGTPASQEQPIPPRARWRQLRGMCPCRPDKGKKCLFAGIERR